MPLVTADPALRTTPLRVWANGRLHEDPEQATVAVTDHGLVVGDGVFEALKVTAAGPFALRRHLERLDRSAAALGLPPADHAVIRGAVGELLVGQEVELGKIRITYTAGRGPLGSGPAYGPQTLVVALDGAEAPTPSTAVVTSPWARNEHGALTGVKSTSYAENVRVLAHAAAHGASEALMLNTAGHLCEGTGSNVFVVLGGRVVTPPLAAGALAGITRDLVLEWTEVEERDLTLDEALAADEVFLTSSLRDVQPVHRWDAATFGAHPVTDAVARVFAERSQADLEP
ncbi:branched-chain amino acid aminotransferase [Friedmanniella luteola]|uniref:aminodeoxychorismate lyase n=1 Tax=Friedmanniella luteola TaxID=546871 RepID=A0A1H1T080_9ACTN|nr:aminodeoxychorismate lyase [Friedmanniella luteola]SDS53675.1 branched-chain amino acid aminotransferase [Friedmanniella luteola]